MNGTDLLKSIGDIDDALIHEAYINTADSTPAQWSGCINLPRIHLNQL